MRVDAMFYSRRCNVNTANVDRQHLSAWKKRPDRLGVRGSGVNLASSHDHDQA